jgi:hypothetical protein
METVVDKKTESNKMDRSKPFVKALRLVPDNPNNSKPRMEETNPKEFTIFPRKAWEKMFDKAGNPVLPNFNWKFVESVSNDGSLKQK